MKKMISLITILLLFGCLTILSGCKKDEIPVPKPNPVDPGTLPSTGFTLYEIDGIEGYSIGDYTGADTVVRIRSEWTDDDGNVKKVVKIKDGTFAQNDKITKVIIPETIQMIGKNAFSKCSALKEVVFEGASELQYIDDNAFAECRSLNNLVLPILKLQMIGNNAFYHCTNISELEVPLSVTSIGSSAFGGMTSLVRISLPFIGEKQGAAGAQAVLGYVFGNIKEDYTVATEQKISEVNTKTYYLPTSLKTIDIMKTYKISFGAFSGLTSVNTIILPVTLTTIDNYAFYKADGLSTIGYRGTREAWENIAIRTNNDLLESMTIQYSYEG